MAKSNLPSVDSPAKAEHQEPRQRPAQQQIVEHDPIIAEGYMPRRVDVKLPMAHRRILRDKLRILQDSGARLQDGTEVSDKTKAVLWILENEVMV